MTWSNVRKRVEDSFADCVRGRVQVFSTRYGACTCGRGAIRVDGKEIANFCTMQFWRYSERKLFEAPTYDPSAPRNTGKLVEKGEFNRFDLYNACWTYLHSNIRECLASENPILLTLALMSKKVGKNRLKEFKTRDLHPLTRSLLNFRLDAERQSEQVAPPKLGSPSAQRAAGC